MRDPRKLDINIFTTFKTIIINYLYSLQLTRGNHLPPRLEWIKKDDHSTYQVIHPLKGCMMCLRCISKV